MARFFGEVGYGFTEETKPGVWEDVVTVRNYYGDVLRNTRRLENGESVNNDISIGNSFSIVADAYAMSHFFAIRYLKWMGALWIVTSVEVQSPPSYPAGGRSVQWANAYNSKRCLKDYWGLGTYISSHRLLFL